MDLFSGTHEKYHITGMKDGLLCVADDCPKDLLEELRKVDEQCVKDMGRHLYDVFAKEGADGKLCE